MENVASIENGPFVQKCGNHATEHGKSHLAAFIQIVGDFQHNLGVSENLSQNKQGQLLLGNGAKR